MTTSKKITLTTIKSFIKASGDQLHISCLTRFDGMTDGTEQCKDRSFRPAVAPNRDGKPFRSLGRDNTLGIQGAWFVFDSRDHFTAFDDGTFAGYRVYNCCGSFILAVRKPAPAQAATAAA
jgi:hypothetical protein